MTLRHSQEFDTRLDDIEFNKENTRQFLHAGTYHFILMDWVTPPDLLLLQTQSTREYRLVSRRDFTTLCAFKALPTPEINAVGTSCYSITVWRSAHIDNPERLSGFGDAFMRYFLTQFVIMVTYDESIGPKKRFWHHHITRAMAEGGCVYTAPSVESQLTPLQGAEELIEQVEKSPLSQLIFISTQPLPFNINKEHDVYQSSTPYV